MNKKTLKMNLKIRLYSDHLRSGVFSPGPGGSPAEFRSKLKAPEATPDNTALPLLSKAGVFNLFQGPLN